MTSGGKSFNDFREIVPTGEITIKIEKVFLVFSSVAVGLFLECAQCCSINSTHSNPALRVLYGLITRPIYQLILRRDRTVKNHASYPTLFGSIIAQAASVAESVMNRSCVCLSVRLSAAARQRSSTATRGYK